MHPAGRAQDQAARGVKAQLCRAFVATLGRIDNPTLLPLALAQAQSLVPGGQNGLALLYEFAWRREWPARYLAARLLGERSAEAGASEQAAAWPVLVHLAADSERWVAEGAAWGFGALLRDDPGHWRPHVLAAFSRASDGTAHGVAHNAMHGVLHDGLTIQAHVHEDAPPGPQGEARGAMPHQMQDGAVDTVSEPAAAPGTLRRALLFGVVPAVRKGPPAAQDVALEVIDVAAGDPSSATRQLGSLIVGREVAEHLPQAAVDLVERWAASESAARRWQAARALTPRLRAVDLPRTAAVAAQLEQAADPRIRNALRGALKEEGVDASADLLSHLEPSKLGTTSPSGSITSPSGSSERTLASPIERTGDHADGKRTNWQTTADIPIGERVIDQVIGQDQAVEIVRLAAQQKRFVLMVGEPGTGKSMLAAAMAEMMGADDLEDVLVLPNTESRITPMLQTVPAGEGEREVLQAKKRRGEAETAITFLFWAASLAVSLIAGWYALATRSAVPGVIAAVVVAVLWGVRRFFQSPVRLTVPKLLVNNARSVEVDQAPVVDATGFHAGALLGDVRHDPFQSGGYETPPHELVEPGAIHLAHRGVLFIDEVSTLTIESQQSLLTAIQEKRFPISGRTLGSSGTMIRSAAAPCDFLLILAGNMEDVEKMHPALRSRVRGYGYELYMREDMPDTADNQAKLARFCAQEVTKDRKIPHLSCTAVEAVIEEARRRAGRPGRLTTRLRELGGLVRAAGDVATQAGDPLVEPRHVATARQNTRTLEEQMRARVEQADDGA